MWKGRECRALLPLAAGLIGVLLLAACTTSTGDGAGGPTSTTAPAGIAGTEQLVVEAGEPLAGGSLVVAVEGHGDGFDPTTTPWSTSALTMAGAMLEPLAAFDADGTVRPYLAESIVANDDATAWDITLRPGITFHNGEAFDANALALFLTEMRRSPVTGQMIAPVDPVEPVALIDERTVRVRLRSPWVEFPTALTGQAGMVVAPEQLTNPDAAWRADHPIGTGPFRVWEWVPGDHLLVVRSDDYWQEGLPYLDSIAFRPIADDGDREAALIAGDVDLIMTSSAATVDRLRPTAEQGELQLVADRMGRPQEALVLNLDRPPLDDQRLRLAVAHAVDGDRVIAVADAAGTLRSPGPFGTGSRWSSGTNLPASDPARADDLVQAFEAEAGPARLTLTSSDDVEGQAVAAAIADDLRAVGFDVDLVVTEPTAAAAGLLLGDVAAAVVTLPGSPDPDGVLHTFASSSAAPVGRRAIGLNAARVRDPRIDDAIARSRVTGDEQVRRDAYAELQSLLAEVEPYVWLYERTTYLVAGPSIHGFLGAPLPDGSAALPMTSGVPNLSQTWRSD